MTDLYEIEPIKEVIYEPYLKIPRKLNEGSPYQIEFCYHTNVKLPKDEYVIEKILRKALFIKLFTKINNNWDTFTEHNKNILWEYIQLLYVLSKNIINISV